MQPGSPLFSAVVPSRDVWGGLPENVSGHRFCGEWRLPGQSVGCAGRAVGPTLACLPGLQDPGLQAADSALLPSPMTFLSLLQCVILPSSEVFLDLKIQFLSCLNYYRQYMVYLRGILTGRWTLPGMERWDQVITYLHLMHLSANLSPFSMLFQESIVVSLINSCKNGNCVKWDTRKANTYVRVCSSNLKSANRSCCLTVFFSKFSSLFAH